MNWLEQLLPPTLVRALGWTLIHSLWQGAVVALALAALLLLLRRHSAQVRYHAAATALLTLLLLCGLTFGRYYYQVPPTSPAAATVGQLSETTDVPAVALAAAAPLARPAAEPAAASWLASGRVYFDANLPLLVTVWLMGLLVMMLRLLGSLAYVQRLRRYRVQPLAQEWQQRLAALAHRAGLKQRVELLESALVKVPVVVGHLRPVVLLPLGTVTGLSTAYLEAILAHELAHVQRRDYLVNLLQAVAETVLFYHPGVWFLAACLRTERENCCDDVATALVGGNPLTVARALAALAELTAAPEPAGQLALSALGPDGSVLGRIRRLVQGRQRPTFAEGFMAACVVLVGLVVLSTAVALARPAASSLSNTLAKPVTVDLLDAEYARTIDPTTGKPFDPAAGIVEAIRILSVSADGQARARIGSTEINFDTTRNQRLMRWSRAGRGGPNPGTVVIKRDKKGRLTELYVDGQKIEVAPARKEAEQVDVVQLDNPRTYSGGEDVDGATRRALHEAGVETSKTDFNAAMNQALAEINNVMQDTDTKIIVRDALQQAEVELRTAVGSQQAEAELRMAARNAKTDEERARIQAQLEEVREQQQQAREDQAQQRRDIEQRRRDMEQRMRDKQQALRDMEQARRDQDQVRRDQEQAKRDVEQVKRDETTAVLLRELRRDKIIDNTDNLQFSLSASRLTVNGKQQPAAVQQKYLRLIEQRQGRPLKGNYNLNYQTSSSTSTTINGRGTMRTPPVPRTPRTPQAPPALPAPPTPPRLDTEDIRAELRRDGLIGATDQGFQFQLNGERMIVNGQQQPATVADKYRRLLDVKPDADGKTRRNVQTSVNE